jgi:hypothetical protein
MSFLDIIDNWKFHRNFKLESDLDGYSDSGNDSFFLKLTNTLNITKTRKARTAVSGQPQHLPHAELELI